MSIKMMNLRVISVGFKMKFIYAGKWYFCYKYYRNLNYTL